MKSNHFKMIGTFQQFTLLLSKLGKVVDNLVILLVFHFLILFYDETWSTEYLLIALVSILLFDLIASIFEIYRSWRIVRYLHELKKIFLYWVATAGIVLTLILSFFETFPLNHKLIMVWFLMSFIFIAIFRYIIRVVVRYFYFFGYDTKIVAFIGATDVSLSLANRFKAYPWMGLKGFSFYDDRNDEERNSSLTTEDIAGDIEDLINLAETNKVDIIYISLPLAAEKRIKELIKRFSQTTVSIYYCPSFVEFDLLHTRWDEVDGQPVISIIESPFQGSVSWIKRTEDIILTLLIMPIIIVPMTVIALAIKLTSPGNIVYKQTRYGLDGKEFSCWKFRSMYSTENDHEFSQATKHDPRVTPIGKFLRKYSLDELPQFINVLIGNMSVIGPRPHPVKLNEQHRKSIHRYMVRHIVKPGITGLAQVNGCRGETETLEAMEKRINFDLEYIRNWSLILDMKIFLKTIFIFLNDKKAY